MSKLGNTIICTLVGIIAIGAYSVPAAAKFIGAKPRTVCCCACAGGGSSDCVKGAGSEGGGCNVQGCSVTGEGLSHSHPVVSAAGANGVGLNLSLDYQTSLADGEIGTIDTVLGPGWTHPYNDFLFQQGRDLFGIGSGSTVIKYARSGRTGALSPTRGYRQTIVESPDGSIEITDFVGGVTRRFERVAGNPLRVAGVEPMMLTQIQDRDGNRTILAYGGGLLRTVTDPYGRVIELRDYDPRNHVRTIKAPATAAEPAGRLTRLTYDSAGNLATITDPVGNLTRFSYTARHQFQERIEPNGNRWTYRYDSAGRLVEVKDQSGKAVQVFANNQGWATSAADLLRDKQRVYQVDPVTAVAITRVTDGNGKVWQYHYNSNGYIVKVIAPDGAETSYQYDATGYNLESVTDANLHRTSYEYDGKLRLVRETDAKDFATAYTYADSTRPPVEYSGPDCPDEIHAIVYPNGSRTEYAYDAQCRRVTETRDLGGLNLVRRWTYNSDGTVATETDPNNHATSHAYDTFGNLVQTTDPETKVTRYAYDVYGNRTCTVDGNGHVTIAIYDAINRLTREVVRIGEQVGPRNPLEPVCYSNPRYDDQDIVTAEYYYDGAGNKTLVRHQSNNAAPRAWQVTRYQYDNRNRLVREFNDPSGEPLNANPSPLNLATAYSYDGNNNRTLATDPRGYRTNYSYDAQNRPIKVKDALANQTELHYDPVGNRICEIDANGHYTVFDYDALNRLVSQARKMGTQDCGSADADDLVTRHFYDSGAAMACFADPGSPPCAGPMPGGSNSAYSIDPDGNYSYSKYDQVDRRWIAIRKVGDTADTCDPAGHANGQDWCEYTQYDAADNVTARRDANGNRIAMAYLTNDWLATETQDPGGLNLVTTHTYDGAGNGATLANPRGNVLANTYDERNQLIRVVDTLGLVAAYAYDGIGNRRHECDGNGNCTAYAFDAANRLIEVIDALGMGTVNDYDANGNLIQVTDRKVSITCHRYDAINRRIMTVQKVGDSDCAVIDAEDIWTRTDFDAVGNVKALTTARLSAPPACVAPIPAADCQTTAYDYDAADRLHCETYADATTRCFDYDMAGNLTRRVDQLGRLTEYHYSDLYYLLARDYQDPAEPDDSFAYDIGGRMRSAAHGSWIVTYHAYDAVNRLLQTTQDSTGTPMVVAYRYDSVAGTRTLAYPGRVADRRVCDEQTDLRGRLSEVTCDSFDAQYVYDLGNRVRTRTYNNGITATYGYNANNWITSLVHSNGGTVADFGYDYDAEGNKLFEDKVHDPAKSEAYAYDAADRLIDYKVGELVGSTVLMPSTQHQYDLDKVGNWDQFTIDGVLFHNTPNQMNEYDDWSTDGSGEIPDDLGLAINFKDPVPTPPEDGENWSHDKNGNRREDGKRRYEYDAENRLTRVQRKSDNLVSIYQYDALGRRVVKIVDALGPVPVVTRYASDDSREIAEQDALGATLATYVYGNYIDEALNMQRGAVDYYYHQNALWSVIAVTDASANVVEWYSYTDFGCPSISGNAKANPWMFTGRRWDTESELYFYRTRYYNCDGGRWLTRDPIADESFLRELMHGRSVGEQSRIKHMKYQAQLYMYASGNPRNRIDPYGLWCWPWNDYEIEVMGDGSTKVTVCDKCVIVVLRGHGSSSKPHTFVFSESCSAGGFVGCDAGTTNKQIAEGNRVNDLMLTDGELWSGPNTGNRPKESSFSYWLQKAKAGSETKAKAICADKKCCCKKIKVYNVLAGKTLDPANWAVPGGWKDFEVKCDP